MTSITDLPIAPSRPRRRSLWLIDFVLSPFTDTDDRAYYKVAARRAARNAGAPVTLRTAALPGQARPPLKRFPRDGE
jgi:hypothetical protein